MDVPKLNLSLSQLRSIPNLMSLLRIVLIPFFMWRYLTAATPGEFWAASVLLIVSGLTDMLDGLIARRCNMVTELGKILDPVADKLTQLAILVCLTLRYHVFIFLLLVLAVKELLMLVGGAILLHRRIHPGGAKWFGKVATCFFYLSMIVVVLIPCMPPAFVNTVILINILLLAFALGMYIPIFFRLRKEYN